MISRVFVTTALILILTLVACQQEIAVTEGKVLDSLSNEVTVPSNIKIQMPPPRKQASMVYDPIRKVTVLFGGTDSDRNLFNDTWEYDGKLWRNIETSKAPSARFMHSMTYDNKREVVVLFGGSTSQLEYNNDTWIYNGLTWQQVEVSIAPPQRHSAAMTYDLQQETTVLFGGYAKGGQQSDFWLFDGHNWQDARIMPTSPPLTFPHMTYDAIRNEFVIQAFGNLATYQLKFADLQNDNEVNSFRSPSNLGSIVGFSMVYDLQRAKTILYGGESGLKEVPHWEFDGKEWHQILLVESPPERLFHTMAYDQARGVVVIFGGMNSDGDLLNDTWEYDGTTWSQR